MDIEAEVSRRISDVFPNLLSKPGFSLPKIDDLATIRIDSAAQDLGDLRAAGVQLANPVDDLRIYYDHSEPPKCKLTIFCAYPKLPGRVIVLGKGATYYGILHMDGQDQTCIIGRSGGAFHSQGIIRGNRSALFVGECTTSNGVRLTVHGPSTGIAIGDDCMFAHGIEIAASDCHSIIDIKARTVINPPQNTIISPHVWIGAHAQILKGQTIGQGSIVGAGALVTSAVPPRSIAAGVPSRILRSEVTWSRHNMAGQRQIDFEIDRLTTFADGSNQ
jgi:acetyltransferase-like isoleucine patch superfamily enzyme